MANAFDGNPWILDTVMATPRKESWVRVANAIWTEQAAAGDQLVIKDGNGRVIIDIKANGANNVQPIGNFGWVNGIQLTTITSGKVYLYLHKG